LRIAGAFDMGKAINPRIVEGQIEGAAAMGIGTALYEQIVQENGNVVNPSFVDYKIVTSLDTPANEYSKSMIAAVPDPAGPLGAKGVGEVVLVPPAPAIANAVYNAVGVRVKDMPISREKVLKLLKERQKV